VRVKFQDLKSDFNVNSHYTCEENERKKKIITVFIILVNTEGIVNRNGGSTGGNTRTVLKICLK